MKAAQNVVGLVGLTLGVIPLVMFLFTGRVGLWGPLVITGPMPWIAPLLVAVTAGIALVVLERRDRA
ncbi:MULTISPECIES: hypothetical protein [Pseudonocardia]|uniref:Uncharacterized protein n=2 Tax=Pseudonocardia TaxID=1847 RepID=A0A1Y2N4B8_PSEAH|nr:MULTISPECIES: hypothetical protein [Pseudonocardia]OSY42333.1 hypothetical protein BG845_01253 [Pseudonocardia autotrophica]TDN75853.1 hypothetical protein C8E95_5038 [Pseudonocardia autotrophica]BBF99824.1 hypothetical protein Pdca_10340 [Pseudonocardia autotrophica]GEC27590.1 hypothetical protein PSA01_46190 [Pseudonocardia saturnea]